MNKNVAYFETRSFSRKFEIHENGKWIFPQFSIILIILHKGEKDFVHNFTPMANVLKYDLSKREIGKQAFPRNF